MKYWLLLIALMAYTKALVHYKKFPKGADGCMVNGTELKVSEVAQDSNVCGVFHCQSREGDVLILYCQITPYFAKCETNGVNTEMDFPDCCWTCTHWKHCSAQAPHSYTGASHTAVTL